jgi:predicted aspartyl protease
MHSRSPSQLSIIVASFTLLAIIAHEAVGQAQSTAPNSPLESGPPQAFGDLLNKACNSDVLEWIPEQKRLLVSAKVNGKEAKFKIDTGALVTLLTLKSAKERELRIIDANATFTGAGGTGKIYGSPVRRLQLGGSVDLSAQRLVVIDLPILDGIDGLIGGDTLASTNAIIDYRQHKLHVPLKTASVDLQKASTEAGMLASKLEREGNYVFLTLNFGKEPIRLLVDTGATRTTIGTKVAGRLKLQVKESAERAVGAGDKAIAIQTAEIEALTVGKAQFRTVECVVMPLEYLAAYSKTEIDGILGADCLAAAGAVLSIADSTVVLPPHDVVVSESDTDAKR